MKSSCVASMGSRKEKESWSREMVRSSEGIIDGMKFKEGSLTEASTRILLFVSTSMVGSKARCQ